MDEYINKKAFLESQIKRCKHFPPLVGTCTMDNITLESEIMKFPSADVEPVVHARWICIGDIDENIYECSRCHEIWCLNDGAPKENNMNYCSNCGAKMDGGEIKNV